MSPRPRAGDAAPEVPLPVSPSLAPGRANLLVHPAWAALLVVALAWIAQGGALAGDWRHDDRAVLTGQGEPGAHASVGAALAPGAWESTFESGAWRPVASLSLALEAPLWEGADPGAPAFGFRATNLVLHGLAALLLLLALHAAGLGLVALGAAAVFAAHPAQVPTVASLAGRADLLAVVFSLGAALAWFAAGPGRRAWLPVAALLYLLALLSKETALGLPLVLLLVSAARGAGGDEPLRRRALFATVFLAPLAVWWVAGPLAAPDTAVGDRLLSATVDMGRAALRLAAPVALTEEPVAEVADGALSDGDRLVAILALAVTAVAGALALARRARLAALAWLAFVAAAVPAALAVAAVGGARFPFVPQVPLFVIAGALLAAVLRAPVPRFVRAAGAVLGSLALVVLSRAEGAVWSDPVVYEETLLRNDPDNPRPLVRLARTAREAAEDDLARASRLRVDEPEYDRLVVRARQGLERAKESARKALNLPEGRDSAAAWGELGAILHAQRQTLAEAALALERALELDPLTASADVESATPARKEDLSQNLFRLGLVHEALGDLDHAAFRFESAARLRPDDLRRVEKAGAALVRVHSYGAGIGWLERALRLARAPDARTRLARTLDEARRAQVDMAKARMSEARRAEEEGEDGARRASDLYEAAILADPSLVEAYLQAARIRVHMGDFRRARALLGDAERQLATLQTSRKDEFAREVSRLRTKMEAMEREAEAAGN